MINVLKHFVDTLFVSLNYLTIIATPIYILLNILNICSFGKGFVDLIAIAVAVVLFRICSKIAFNARKIHGGGDNYLFPTFKN